jgi:hypothetical protein
VTLARVSAVLSCVISNHHNAKAKTFFCGAKTVLQRASQTDSKHVAGLTLNLMSEIECDDLQQSANLSSASSQHIACCGYFRTPLSSSPRVCPSSSAGEAHTPCLARMKIVRLAALHAKALAKPLANLRAHTTDPNPSQLSSAQRDIGGDASAKQTPHQQ